MLAIIFLGRGIMANVLTPLDKKLIGFFCLTHTCETIYTKNNEKTKSQVRCLKFSSKTKQEFVFSISTRLTLTMETKLVLNLPVYQ